MLFIRSLIFNIYYVFCTVFFCSLGVLLYIFPSKVRSFNAAMWGKSLLWGCGFFVGITYEVRGRENLPEGNRFILASKHQSALETMAFHFLLKRPAYVLKKELLYIPFFGWNLQSTGCIPIDRSSGAKAMRSILSGSQKRLAENRPVIIFPEGTRIAPETDSVYNPGVGLLYEKCNVPVIPTALNSGYFWPKKAFIKRPGHIVIEFLPAMPEGLSKRELVQQLKERIEKACAELKPL